MDESGAKSKAQKAAAAARELLLESEASVLRALANSRAVISQLEDELCELRRQVARQQIEIFTEEEFAAKLKVSPATLARLRRAGRIEAMELGLQSFRYTSLQLEQAHETFARKKKGRR